MYTRKNRVILRAENRSRRRFHAYLMTPGYDEPVALWLLYCEAEALCRRLQPAPRLADQGNHFAGMA